MLALLPPASTLKTSQVAPSRPMKRTRGSSGSFNAADWEKACTIARACASVAHETG